MGKHGPSIKIEFNGEKFRRYPESPNRAMRRYFFSQGGRSLHKAIWEASRGPVPAGFHVHHQNGDSTDNRLRNLEIIDGSEHLRMHALEPGRVAKSRVNIAIARSAASIWHGSPEGRAWHSRNAINIARNAKPKPRTCLVCGGGFESVRKAGVCSGYCSSKQRKQSGIDDIDCNCIECGVAFRRNRYQRSAGYCGRSCSTRAANRRRATGFQPSG